MSVANVDFPGILRVVRGTYTYAHGEDPGVIQIETEPQLEYALTDGPVTFTDHTGLTVILRDCHVFGYGYQGQATAANPLVIRLWDRRWKWKYGAVWGRYNQRLPDQQLDEQTVKTPHEIAEILFLAMGETGFDYSELPNNTRPETNWQGEPPARVLAEFADRHGCRLVFDPTTDRASIRRIGLGAELPIDSTVTSTSAEISLPEMPDEIWVQCRETVVEGVLILVAVGLETDGTWKYIDDLSYTPAGGWAAETPGIYSGVSETVLSGGIPGKVEAVRVRDLAIGTVFKNYQVWSILDVNGTASQILENLLGIEYLIPEGDPKSVGLRNELITVDRITGNYAEAFIQGTYATLSGTNNSELWQKLENVPFQIDRDLRIVRFDEYVYKFGNPDGNTQTNIPADLYLTCSFTVRHQRNFSTHRHVVKWSTGGTRQTGPYILKDESLGRTIRIIYNNGGIATNQQTNDAQVLADATAVASAASAQFATKTPKTVSYVGIRAIPLDGAIQQVQWTVEAGKGGSTTGSRGNEFKLTTPSYDERRMIADAAKNRQMFNQQRINEFRPRRP
jgi:hypothetical protein